MIAMIMITIRWLFSFAIWGNWGPEQRNCCMAYDRWGWLLQNSFRGSQSRWKEKPDLGLQAFTPGFSPRLLFHSFWTYPLFQSKHPIFLSKPKGRHFLEKISNSSYNHFAFPPWDLMQTLVLTPTKPRITYVDLFHT